MRRERLLPVLFLAACILLCAGCQKGQAIVLNGQKQVSQFVKGIQEKMAGGIADLCEKEQPKEVVQAVVRAEEEAQKAAREAAEREQKKAAAADRLIVIDAGHQGQGNSGQEPVGPGASQTKAKVASGTAGSVTGIPEYEVTLQVSKKLQKQLADRGYPVRMIRETNEVDISNAERARTANENHAAVFLRIHCNGSEDKGAQGAMTICMTPQSPYCPQIYPASRRLCDTVLAALCEKTGAPKERVWETDTMSGINWCEVPVAIVEMGYLTNEAEEAKLVSDDYQELLAEGIADGVEQFFRENAE